MLRDNISDADVQNLVSAVRNVLNDEERGYFDEMTAAGATASDIVTFIVEADEVCDEDEEDCCGPNCCICDDFDDEDDFDDGDDDYVCDDPGCPCNY